MKGAVDIYASIIIMVISITFASTLYLYSSGVIKGTMTENFKLVDIFGNRVIIKNIGREEIKGLKCIVDGIERECNIVNETEKEIAASIMPGQSGKVLIKGITSGIHELQLYTKSMSQRLTWNAEPESIVEVPTETATSTTTSTIATTTTGITTTSTTTSTIATTTTGITTTTTITSCSLNSASITTNCGTCCDPGEAVTMSGSISGDCSIADNFQIDASGIGCSIQYNDGNIRGINANIAVSTTDKSISGVWTIPSVPSSCRGVTVSATTAGIYDGGPPGTGTGIDWSTATGSFRFCSPPSTTTTRTTTTVSTTTTTVCDKNGLSCTDSSVCCISPPEVCRNDYDGTGSWCCDIFQCAHNGACYDEGSTSGSWACCVTYFGGWLKCDSSSVCAVRYCPPDTLYCYPGGTWDTTDIEGLDVGTCKKCHASGIDNYDDYTQDFTDPGFCKGSGEYCFGGKCVSPTTTTKSTTTTIQETCNSMGGYCLSYSDCDRFGGENIGKYDCSATKYCCLI